MDVEKKVEPGGAGEEEVEEGVDPDDELYATAPRRARRLIAHDWAAGFVSPFVATNEEVAAALMAAAGVGSSHLVLDLGSGEGRLLLAAARRGARAVGYELDAELNAKAEAAAEEQTLAHLVSVRQRDLMAVEAADAASSELAIARENGENGADPTRVLVVMFLLPECLEKLRASTRACLEKGYQVVSVQWPALEDNSPHLQPSPPGFYFYDSAQPSS